MKNAREFRAETLDAALSEACSALRARIGEIRYDVDDAVWRRVAGTVQRDGNVVAFPVIRGGVYSIVLADAGTGPSRRASPPAAARAPFPGHRRPSPARWRNARARA